MKSAIGVYMEDVCERHISFSRLTRAEKERAFRIVRKEKGSKIVTVDEMLAAHLAVVAKN
jgi:hypothetical protein